MKRTSAVAVKQILLGRMEVFCYIVGDDATGTCALIDPAFETDRILYEVKTAGYVVTHVINTHGHSDHTAGNSSIIAGTGALLLIHQKDAGQLAGFPNSAFSRMMGGKGSPRADILLKDRDIVKVGQTELNVLHTPGHTPGSICLYTPGHVFTGDTLFVGAVGRADLPGGCMKQLL
jgi:hydroxyacylglutathione hydrolase